MQLSLLKNCGGYLNRVRLLSPHGSSPLLLVFLVGSCFNRPGSFGSRKIHRKIGDWKLPEGSTRCIWNPSENGAQLMNIWPIRGQKHPYYLVDFTSRDVGGIGPIVTTRDSSFPIGMAEISICLRFQALCVSLKIVWLKHRLIMVTLDLYNMEVHTLCCNVWMHLDVSPKDKLAFLQVQF